MAVSPKRINPFTLAKQGAELKGKLSLAKMEELTPLLNRVEGEAEYELHFNLSEGRKTIIQGVVRAEVPLLCQRCGQELLYPLMVETHLQAVTSDAAAAKVDAPYEPLLVGEDQTVELVDLLEEEIILALPMFAKHADPECVNQEVQ